jgi:hypothetical protein
MRLERIGKMIYCLAAWWYIATELGSTIQNQINFHPGDKEIYNLLHGRSSLLTTYSNPEV